MERRNQLMPTEMAVDPGTVVLGRRLETGSDRSPLYRLAGCRAQHDPARRLGQAVPSEAVNEEVVC